MLLFGIVKCASNRHQLIGCYVETVLYSLRLFVVGGEHIAMAMVLHLYTKYHGCIYTTLSTSYWLIHCLRLCVAMATCNLVGKMLLMSIIRMSNYTFIVYSL